MPAIPNSKPTPETMEDFLDHGIAKVQNPTESTCDICLSKFALDDYAVQILGINGCWHILGRKCLTTWLYVRNTCPLCRVKLHGSFRPPPDFGPQASRDETPRRPQLGPINPRSTNTSDLAGLGRYTTQDAEPLSRRRHPSFDVYQELEPRSRYPTFQTAVGLPRTEAARRQRNHRIMMQIHMTRETRQDCEDALSDANDSRLIRQKIRELNDEELRLRSQLEEVPQAPAPDAEIATPIFRAQFSMATADAGIEEERPKGGPLTWVRRCLGRKGRK